MGIMNTAKRHLSTIREVCPLVELQESLSFEGVDLQELSEAGIEHLEGEISWSEEEITRSEDEIARSEGEIARKDSGGCVSDKPECDQADECEKPVEFQGTRGLCFLCTSGSVW